jgi:hypothetical protein
MNGWLRLLAAITLAASAAIWPTAVLASGPSRLIDRMLSLALQAAGFTGRIAHIPPTELVEVAGFTGTFGQLEPRFAQFDDGLGGIVPSPDANGFRNEPIRQALLARLNANSE